MKRKAVIRSRVLCGHPACVVWLPCLAILCYMGGDVGHVVYMCEGGGGGVYSQCKSR